MYQKINFIVDFYCAAANLVIECDGHQHFTEDGLAADQVRDQALVELDLTVLRFDNRQILVEIDGVVEQIHLHCLKESPKSLFEKEGLPRI